MKRKSVTVEKMEPDWEKAVDAVTLFLVDTPITSRLHGEMRKTPNLRDRVLAREIVEVVKDNL